MDERPVAGYAPHMGDAGKIPQGYLQQSRDLVNSLVLVLPLLLLYQLGLLVTGLQTVNGVDFISYFLATRWGLSGLLVFNGLLFLAGMIGVHQLRKGRRLEPKILVPVTIESTCYALVLGSVIIFVMRKLHVPMAIEPSAAAGLAIGPLPPLAAGAQQWGLLDRVFLSLGAGVNEELVFRLGLYTGIYKLADTVMPKGAAIALGVFVSSLLFSLAHYLGPESFQIGTFVYRLLAGAIFCGLFEGRGFAVACYTHAIYDVYVMVFLQG